MQKKFTKLTLLNQISLHYNFSNSYLFVNGTQELKFKSKSAQILKEKLCTGNSSNDWTTTNSEKWIVWKNL